jgi:hypothetical protein
MAAEPALRLIDGRQVVEGSAAELWAKIEQLGGDLANAERDLRSKRALITKLQRDKQREREECIERELVEEIFAEWQEVCGHARSKLTPERFDAIQARIQDGYERADFAKAIAGGSFDPFITKAKNGRMIRHDDIELICRDGKHFESFANRAPRNEPVQ